VPFLLDCHFLIEIFTLGSKSYISSSKNPEVPESTKASYLVFPWGTNDPPEAAAKKGDQSSSTEYMRFFPFDFVT
jgi:hypothetical protein